jgi:hypothetical protein
MKFWIKNTDGKPDAMLTFAAIAFAVVIFKFLLAGVSFKIKGQDVSAGQVDASTIAALLTPTLGAYVARRHSETKYGAGPDGIEGTDDDVPEPAHGKKDA